MHLFHIPEGSIQNRNQYISVLNGAFLDMLQVQSGICGIVSIGGYVSHPTDNPADTSGPFYLHGLTLIPAWISNYMPRKVWNKITYPLLIFNVDGCTLKFRNR